MLHKNLAISRFFSEGPAVVAAIDQGMFDGPIAGLEDLRSIPGAILPDIDAVLMSPGALSDIGTALCGRRDSPLAIARINWSSARCRREEFHFAETVTACPPPEALRLGAHLVLASVSLGTGDEGRDARQVGLFSELCQAAHAVGLAVIGEYLPVDPQRLSEEDLGQEISKGCRVLYELGADVISTLHTKNFTEVAAGCPAPILSVAGQRMTSDLEVLQCAQQQIRSGAAGIVFGRSVIQSGRSLELQRALMAVVKEDAEAEEAAELFGLVPAAMPRTIPGRWEVDPKVR